MALRQREVDKENMSTRQLAKSAIVKPIEVISKRPALGEVGNKLHTINKNVPSKKFGIMGPPQALAMKTAHHPVPKKEVNKMPKKSTVSLKNTLTRQEFILKNISVDDKKPTNKNLTKSYSTKQLNIVDPDENSKNDPQMVTEYLGDIFSYLRDLEDMYPIRENFLEGHEITSRMRSLLVDWLVELHMHYEFYLEALHLCVAIVDRYLQDNKNVGRSTLQLVGTSAMLIASKYEMHTPDLTGFFGICDNYSPRQILQMEREILKSLDFSLGRPVSLHFLRRYNKIAQVRGDHLTMGKYILELALLDYKMSHVKPSILAAATCCLSMGVLNEVMDISKLWTPTLAHYTNYKYTDFENIITDLGCMIAKSESSKFETIRKKYASSSNSKISLSMKLSGPLIRKHASSK